MPEINLAAEVFRARLMARRRRLLYVVSVALLLVLVGAWGIPLWFTRNTRQQIQVVETDITGIEARLTERRDDARSIVLFRRRLSLLRQRIGARIGWSKVLSMLERLTPPDVVYRSLGGSADGGAIDATVVVSSLDVAADLIASLQYGPDEAEKLFGIVEITEVQAIESPGEAGTYLVHLHINVNPSAFALGPRPAGSS